MSGSLDRIKTSGSENRPPPLQKRGQQDAKDDHANGRCVRRRDRRSEIAPRHDRAHGGDQGHEQTHLPHGHMAQREVIEDEGDRATHDTDKADERGNLVVEAHEIDGRALDGHEHKQAEERRRGELQRAHSGSASVGLCNPAGDQLVGTDEQNGNDTQQVALERAAAMIALPLNQKNGSCDGDGGPDENAGPKRLPQYGPTEYGHEDRHGADDDARADHARIGDPQTRNSEAMPGSSRPMTIGPSPMCRSPLSWRIMTAPMRNRMLVISVTASTSTANLLAIIVDAQQAVARTMASAGMSACL